MVDHQRVQGWPSGREGLRELVVAWRKGFPDLTEYVQDLIAEGDKVVARYTLQGTHMGVFLGIQPTGQRVQVEGIDIARFRDGRIVEFWYSQDSYGLFRQLGVFPWDDQKIPGSS
jgi:predicted ester cyclase